MIRRVCVVGAGAIGSLLAAHLARVAEVAVLTRREEHARALNAEGLRVSGRGDFVARVTASSDPGSVGDCDLVILATKATEVDAAAGRLAGRFDGAAVMTVQNGLGAEAIVRRHGDWPLISSVTFMSGTRHSDTHVEYILDTVEPGEVGREERPDRPAPDHADPHRPSPCRPARLTVGLTSTRPPGP